MGVFLAHASTQGPTLLDRALYLPAAWTADRDRCRRAGIPDDRAFATTPALAHQMLERTFDAGVALAWVTGDRVYGDDRAVRQWLDDRRQAYVLAVALPATAGIDPVQRSVTSVVTDLPRDGWERISAGAGSTGLRWYDWRRVALRDPAQAGWQRWLLLRRSISDPRDLTAYRAFAPAATPMTERVRVAGTRWSVEESIQTAKGEVGRDHDDVRSWTGW